MKTDLQAIVLAAGKSTRLNTGNTKLIEKMCGQEMILYPTTLLEHCGIPTTLITGYQKEVVQKAVTKKHGARVNFIEQKELRGTGDAIISSKKAWHKDNILILNGDMPLMTQDIIEKLYTKHIETDATISFVTTHNPDPTLTYGRIVQTDDHIEIVEAKEFEGDTHEHCCVNAGLYITKRSFLEQHIDAIQQSEKTQEFYITDLVKIASQEKLTVSTISAPFDRTRGINTYQELWAAEQVKRSDLIKYWMDHGVRFSTAHSVHIDLDVTIGAGTFIGCSVHLRGSTTIGKNCTIDKFSLIKNSTLADNVKIEPHCIVKDAHIEAHATIGPFAHIQEGTLIKANATIGNFVEVKRSTIGVGAKAKHLAYLGDVTVGDNANIGAGTIVCNYDGFNKHKTIIKEQAQIGSNTSLIAPVTIGTGAFTGAGSVITDDVPNNAVAFGRAKQINKPNYATTLRERNTEKKEEQSNTQSDNQSGGFSFMGAIKTNNDSPPTAE